MSTLIVVRIIPAQPVKPDDFTKYLNGNGLGPLQISAFELSFNDPAPGQPLSTTPAPYVAPTTGPTPTVGWPIPGPSPTFKSPKYSASPKSGIIQQYDLAPGTPSDSAFYQLKSVATAIIEVQAGTTVQNIRLQVQWGTGASATPVPVNMDFYDVITAAGPAPDLNTWNPSTSSTDLIPDPWAQLATNVYIHLPAPPSTSNPFSFQLPADGTPPPFDSLMTAVQQMIKTDPGLSVNETTTAAASAGDLVLQFGAPISGISVGMMTATATGSGIPANTIVTGIDSGTGKVTLSHELSAGIASGTTIKFSPNVGALSVAQCRNIAHEIVWSQQPPPPTPKDPIEELYSDPPNSGSMLKDSSSSPTPNPFEADRQQFEAQLNAYYAVANATADRLTSFVYALSAAVACEQMSLAATQVMLRFRANPDFTSGGSLGEPQVILTGFQAVASPTNFGVPAAYFYGLGALLPLQMAPLRRFQLATGDLLDHTLAALGSAIHSGTVTDSEAFVSVAGSTNGAQAARRIAALGIPSGASIPLAPLDAVALSTTSDTAKGNVLPFGSTTNVKTGMSVSGPQIASGTTVTSLTSASVTLSAPILSDVPPGTTITFTPTYSAGLAAIVKAWLAFPPTVAGGPSTDSYQAGEDDTNFWPTAASANATDFLALVLAAITEGFILPAPINASLGDRIIAAPGLIPSPASVANLAAVTAQQWTDFFKQHPDWLPPGTGNTATRIDSFIARLQQFFAVGAGGPSAKFVVATTAAAAVGDTVLKFAPTSQIIAKMSVSGPSGIPPRTNVASVTASTTTTSVTLNQPITAAILVGTNITFSVVASGGVASPLPTLQSPSQDWLTRCLTTYGAFTLGTGFDPSKLNAAAVTVFPDDPAAQDWIVDALVTLDALYRVLKSVPFATPGFEFSVVEALYARGFTSASGITVLSSDQFQEALIGTVAYDLAGAIYTSASAIASPVPSTPASGSFAPVNPDGSLTNCVPPPCTSPLGPVAYLSELLNLSASSTCDTPVAKPISRATNADALKGSTLLPFAYTSGLFPGMSVSGPNIPANSTVMQVNPTSVTISQPISADVPSASLVTFTAPTLGSVLTTRLGPIGDLLATCANLETPLPLIDIVNESLEYMGAQSDPTGGTVYNTSADQLAGYTLCQEKGCPDDEKNRHCHEPARILGALPEYSTPATPVSANANVSPAVYNKLKKDFSSCRLPYSQALDVSRTYLRHFRTCRFEELRTFRKCITEFVLDPATDPPSFQSHLWRYPVRIDIAIEYLGITPEEYALLFLGATAPPCAGTSDQQPPVTPGLPANPSGPSDPNQPADPARPPVNPNREGSDTSNTSADPATVRALFGIPSDTRNARMGAIAQLPVFLELTCLTYCEFYELWKSGFVDFRNSQQQNGEFPECEPCCLDQISIAFPGQRDRQDQTALLRLALFIRLWRKLKESGCFCYSFSQLRDICDVLHLFDDTGINPDFVRQLAAFQMLRDQFCLELTDPCDKPAATAVDADRTHLLALWVGPKASKWGWAVRYLCEKVVQFAHRHHDCKHRAPDFIDLLVSKLDSLSRLVGFDPTSDADNWHALPTHTLRFVEVLAKLTTSRFTIAEILYLFTVDNPSGCDEIFPLPEESEALERPLDLPDDDCEFSLWRLRRELLDASEIPSSFGAELKISIEAKEGGRPCPETREEARHESWRLEAKISEDGKDEWDWRRVTSVLQEELGFAPSDVIDFARHFFPSVLEKAGYHVDTASSRFVSSLPAAKTTPAMWTVPAEGPFQYDGSGGQLWIRLPMPDRAVIGQLTRLSALNTDEQNAAQDLYFQPRAVLALFAVLFPNFSEAARHLIEEPETDRK